MRENQYRETLEHKGAWEQESLHSSGSGTAMFSHDLQGRIYPKLMDISCHSTQFYKLAFALKFITSESRLITPCHIENSWFYFGTLGKKYVY